MSATPPESGAESGAGAGVGPATDPLNLLSNPPSTVIKVQGTAREDVNGSLGIVVKFSTERGRYVVHMVETQSTMALKPTNIVKASMIESYKAQVLQVIKDPRIRREITKYYNIAQSKLGGIKPEYAGGILLLFLIAAMYFVGFSKTIMVISMLMMIGMIVGPDIVNGASAKLVATNFPRRCREIIVQSAPFLQGRLNDNVAAALVIVMLGFAGRTLFVASPQKAAAAAYAATRGIDGDMSVDESMGDAASRSMMEEDLSGDPPPVYFSDTPIPGSTKKKSFGLREIMSLLFIYRTGKEMGRDPTNGGFNFEIFVAKAKLMEPWKLGILGFSVYNLVSSYL